MDRLPDANDVEYEGGLESLQVASCSRFELCHELKKHFPRKNRLSWKHDPQGAACNSASSSASLSLSDAATEEADRARVIILG